MFLMSFPLIILDKLFLSPLLVVNVFNEHCSLLAQQPAEFKIKVLFVFHLFFNLLTSISVRLLSITVFLFYFLILTCIWTKRQVKKNWLYNLRITSTKSKSRGTKRRSKASDPEWRVYVTAAGSDRLFGEERASVLWRALLPPRRHPRRLHWLVVDCGKC